MIFVFDFVIVTFVASQIMDVHICDSFVNILRSAVLKLDSADHWILSVKTWGFVQKVLFKEGLRWQKVQEQLNQ